MAPQSFIETVNAIPGDEEDRSTEECRSMRHDATQTLRAQIRMAYADHMEQQELLMQKLDAIVVQWSQSHNMLAQGKGEAMNCDMIAEPQQMVMPRNPGNPHFIAEPVLEAEGIKFEYKFTSEASGHSIVESELLKNVNTARMRIGAMDENMEEMKKHAEFLSQYRYAVGPFGSCLDWWLRLKEPRRLGQLATLVQAHNFELMCLIVIICNTVYTIFDTDYSMANKTKHKTVPMSVIEIGFTFFYMVELSLKLWVHRLYYFCNADMGWNILDTFLVVSGILEVITNSSSNPSFVRMIRFVRITRVLRMVRLLRFFAELRLMLTCIIGSIMSLFWAFFLIFALSVLFAIILVQHLATYLADANPAQQISEQITQHFGSVQVATFTLFKGISGGDWTKYYDIVMQTGWFNATVFMIYILFVWLSVTNVITCIFVEKAMKLAHPDIEELLFEKRREEIESAEELQKLFDSLDEAHSRIINWEQFAKCMHDDRIATHFELNGLNVHDAFLFFRMLASTVGSTDIDSNTFVRGCLKMKGVAMNIDLLLLSYEIKIISRNQQHLFNVLEKEMGKLCTALTDNQIKLGGTLRSNMYHIFKEFGQEAPVRPTDENLLRF